MKLLVITNLGWLTESKAPKPNCPLWIIAPLAAAIDPLPNYGPSFVASGVLKDTDIIERFTQVSASYKSIP